MADAKHYSVADGTALVAADFMKPAKLPATRSLDGTAILRRQVCYVAVEPDAALAVSVTRRSRQASVHLRRIRQLLARCGDDGRPPWRPVSGDHPSPRGTRPNRLSPPRLARVSYRSESRRGGCKSWRLFMTDIDTAYAASCAREGHNSSASQTIRSRRRRVRAMGVGW